MILLPLILALLAAFALGVQFGRIVQWRAHRPVHEARRRDRAKIASLQSALAAEKRNTARWAQSYDEQRERNADMAARLANRGRV